MITSGFIKSIQDIMRKDRGIGTGDVVRQLDQLIWMIFLKAFDDIEKQKKFIDSSYSQVVPETYRWSTWASAEEGITGDKLLDFINNDLMPSLRDLPVKDENAIIRIAFEESHNYMKDGTLLRQVINKINSINFNSSDDRHTFNDLYETLLSSLQSAGDAGEYYTPRAVTRFVTEMVAPKLGESVLDPACGTGGFLSSAIDILHEQAKTPEDMELVERSIHGVEKMQLPYSLCVVNMMLHGIENPVNVRYDNTLSKPLISYGPKDYVDTIVANPPFGGQEVDGIEKNFPSNFRTRETADLFLVLMIRLLKDGGRAGIVLPDGTLFGESVKTRIKQHLLEECNLHTIVRLPKSVFAPYTSIATNLLFFTKGTPTKEVWYYEHKLPEGVKAYNKTKPISSKEFEPLKEWWQDRKETDQAWKVSIEDIEKRGYNLDIKNPNIVEVDELNPEEVLENYRKQWRDIDKIADELQCALQETLQHHNNAQASYLTKNLHEYLRVPHAAPLLRNTILRLAVSGQLVSQDPAEGTGQELYDQIRAVKTKLIVEGKLKMQKPLTEIAADDIPFEIPDSWKWVRLGDVTNMVMGQSPDGRDVHDIPQGIPFYQGKTEFGRDNPTPRKWCEHPKKYAEQGSVLISVRAPVGGTNYANELCGIGRGLAAVHPLNKMPKELLRMVLDTNKNYLQSLSTGTTFAAISAGDLLGVPFALPPLAEQTRIVQKTTQLLNLVTKLEQHLEG